MRINLHIGLSGKDRTILLLAALVFFFALRGTAFAEEFEEGLTAYESEDYATALSKFTNVVTEPAPKKSFTLDEFLEKAKPLNPEYSTEELAKAWSKRYGPGREATIARAQFYLGVMYDFGYGVPQDDQEARRWYSKAAEARHPNAQFNLAVKYRKGEGFPKDYQQAMRWYKKAAEQGYADAQFYLGVMYSEGEGVPPDYQQAAQWFRKAAEQGDSSAQFNLGLAYSNGEGVLQDYGEALRWYRQAANQGHAAAQNNLGLKYEYGEGTAQDYVQAHKWYNLAASAATDQESRERAVKNRNSVERRMSSTQIAEAQRLAREWTPTTDTSSDVSLDARASSLASSGSGFVVSRQGHILTNEHVVENCPSLRITLEGEQKELTIVATDKKNDLAIVKLPQPLSKVAAFRDGRNIRAGDQVVAVGYPLHGLLASEASVTTGIVSALAGIGNDTRFYQVTAPVQPGNSGGPLLDKGGHVVGIIVSKLDALAMARITGDIPQNINFAVKDAVAKLFLESHGVRYEKAVSGKEFQAAEIGETAKQFTHLIECYSQKLDRKERALLEAERRALLAERQLIEKDRQLLAAERLKADDARALRLKQEEQARETLEQARPSLSNTEAKSIEETRREGEEARNRARDARAKTQSPIMPTSAFNVAYDHFLKGKYADAVSGFQHFIRIFPGSSLTPSARYWLGESYYNLNDYSHAVQMMEYLVTEYPGNQKVPSALLKIGLASAEMGDLAKSRNYLKRVLEEFPASKEANLAKTKLGETR